jgi:hypothetical protein
MNMIPLVRATEPGRAQHVNRRFRALNCSLDKCYQQEARRKSFWKKASERVRIPYFLVGNLLRTVRFFRVAFFGSGALNGW